MINIWQMQIQIGGVYFGSQLEDMVSLSCRQEFETACHIASTLRKWRVLVVEDEVSSTQRKHCFTIPSAQLEDRKIMLSESGSRSNFLNLCNSIISHLFCYWWVRCWDVCWQHEGPWKSIVTEVEQIRWEQIFSICFSWQGKRLFSWGRIYRWRTQDAPFLAKSTLLVFLIRTNGSV